MCPHDQIDLVQQIEVVHHLVPEDPSSPSRVTPPSLDVLGIGPHEISQRTFMRNFLLPIKQPHLIYCGQIRRKPSMDAEYIPIDDGSERQKVKGFIKILPTVGVAILLVDFVQEAIHHGDVATLMVASEEVDAVRVFDFQAEEECDGLDRVVAPVHEITNHDEFVIRQSSSLRKQVLHVEKLSMDISSNVHRGVHTHNIRLLSKNTLHQVAERPHGGLSDRFTIQRGLVPSLDVHKSNQKQCKHKNEVINLR